MATAEKIVEVHDIGPIENFHFVAPPSGVVVVKGAMGDGKSRFLEAIESASTGKGKPAIRDGADHGEVRIGEVLMRVGKTTRRTENVEFSVITGRYTIADLIDPGFKDRAACDDHAIKTLAQLAGSGDESLFYELCGDQAEFEQLCPADVAGSLDVVALAAKVERGLQARARAEESKADAADGKADAYSTSARDVDCTLEHDAATLQAAYKAAVSAEAALKQRAKEAQRQLTEANTARDALEDAEAAMDGPTVPQVQARVDAAAAAVATATDTVRVAEQALQQANKALNDAKSEEKSARDKLASVQAQQRLLESYRATVGKAQDIEAVAAEELAAAARAVADAERAQEIGILIRKALEDRSKAEEKRREAAEHRKRAERYRSAAAGTDDVLSGLVGKLNSPLFVKRGRLMVKSDRGEESFWDLSDGERSEIAVTIFASHVGKNGLLVLPQSFWEGLDWQGRKRIAEHMQRIGVLAWTAESDKSEAESGPLRAEVYQP